MRQFQSSQVEAAEMANFCKHHKHHHQHQVWNSSDSRKKNPFFFSPFFLFLPQGFPRFRNALHIKKLFILQIETYWDVYGAGNSNKIWPHNVALGVNVNTHVLIHANKPAACVPYYPMSLVFVNTN